MKPGPGRNGQPVGVAAGVAVFASVVSGLFDTRAAVDFAVCWFPTGSANVGVSSEHACDHDPLLLH